jgi:hypothetical protein
MSGLSTLVNATAGAINGYRDQQYQQNAQDYAQQVRANEELKMQAAQDTYQPQAQAQIAQAGLSQVQAQGQASLVPAQTQVAATQIGTQQSAADAAFARQPTLNQTADNQATVQAGTTGTQAQLLPQTQTNMRLQQLSQDHQASFGAVSGLYTTMMQGPQAVQQYMQKMADSGAYPSIAGKRIGTVGLTPDGQNFVTQDDQGNTLFQMPTQQIRQAYQMSLPTQWHNVGNTLVGTQGPNVTSQTSTPEFKVLQPGDTGVISQGNNITNSKQAAVPTEQANRYTAPEVQTMKFLQAGNPKLSTTDAFNIINQAKTLSKEAFVQQGLPNMLTMGGAKDANDATQKLISAWDYMHPAPGLSQAAGSNSNPSSTINSLIGASTAGTTPNPFSQ